jgi:hypothetical protein
MFESYAGRMPRWCIKSSAMGYSGRPSDQWKLYKWRHDTQHKDTQQIDTKHKEIQHNNKQKNDTQFNDNKKSDIVMTLNISK